MATCLSALFWLGGHALALPIAAAQEPATTTSDEERAFLPFEAGVEAYRQGQFDVAIERFQEAFDLSGAPVLLYNLARAHEGAGHAAEAAATYRRYLASDAEIADRAEIEARVSALDPPAPPPVAPVPEPPPPPIDAALFVAIGITALGGAVLIAGAVAAGVANDRYSAARSTEVQVERLARQARAFELATTANVLFVIGGVLAAGGLAWTLVEVLADGGQEPAVRVALGPLSLTVEGRF